MWIRSRTLLWLCAIAGVVGLVTLNFKLAGFAVIDAAIVLCYVWIRGQMRPRAERASQPAETASPSVAVRGPRAEVGSAADRARVLHQAQCIMAEQARCSMDLALDNLKQAAANDGRSLDEEAELLVQGRLRFY